MMSCLKLSEQDTDIGLPGSFCVCQTLNYVSADRHNLIWRLLDFLVIVLHPVIKFMCSTNVLCVETVD